jgi:sRNA-binding protein
MATSKTEATEIIAELASQYPKAFSTDPARVRPLAIGVKEVLFQQSQRSPKSLEKAMRRYTAQMSYLKATIEGAARVDLDGQEAGTVTTGQAVYAQGRLAKMVERLETKPVAPIAVAAARPAMAARTPAVVRTPVVVRTPAAVRTPVAARTPVVVRYDINDRSALKHTVTAPTQSVAQTGPRRLGLADLKRAAAARRSVDAPEAANHH